MRKLLIQPQARLDVLEIWHHIAPDSVDAANRVNARITEAFQGLAEMPGKGHVRADVKNQVYRF